MSSLKPLRPHQIAAMEMLRASIAGGHKRPMVSSPTGSGKTILSAHIVAGAMAKHKRVAFCVPALSLVDQSFERFQENGISPLDMGIQQADHPWRREFAPVQIATAQTLSRRELPQADVVVIDEAHIRFAVYERWMREHPETVFIGLSATPWSAGLGRLFDDLVKPVTIAETQASSSVASADKDGDFAAGNVSTPIQTGTNKVSVDIAVRWAIE